MKTKIDKKSKEHHVQVLVEHTLHSSKIFMEINKKNKIDKSYWAWLHIGYNTALKQCGYSDKDCMDIVSMAIKELSNQ